VEALGEIYHGLIKAVGKLSEGALVIWLSDLLICLWLGRKYAKLLSFYLKTHILWKIQFSDGCMVIRYGQVDLGDSIYI